MRPFRLVLNDGQGGLNNRDHPSGIAKNEFSLLENYYTDDRGAYLRKRGGKELIQYAPIDPTPFTNDASTMGLWHFNESALPYVDSATVNHNFVTEFGNNPPDPATAIFGNGLRFYPITGSLTNRGGNLYTNIPSDNLLDDKAACTIEAWVWINPTYSGRPYLSANTGRYTTNTQSAIVRVGLVDNSNGPTQNDVASAAYKTNGLFVFRDWDYTASKDAGDPYIKFYLRTKGVAGTQTVLTTGSLPFSRWLHIRGTYDSATGYARLYVNGSLEDEQQPVGGGNVDAPNSAVGGSGGVTVGTGLATNINATTGAFLTTLDSAFRPGLDGIIDEVRISDTDRGGLVFPFKNPRGKGFELALPDGTRNAVVSAGDGLYSTVGNGEWTAIINGLDEAAFWDAIQIGDIMYLANGTDQPYAWNGTTLKPWGVPINPPTVTQEVAGTLPAGTYLYATTVVYGDYETGLSPATTQVNAGAGRNAISGMVARHANATAIRVYRTAAGGEIYYLIREITHNVTAIPDMTGVFASTGDSPKYTTDTGADDVQDADLGSTDYPEIASFVLTSLMPQPKYLLAEHRRAFATGDDDEPYTLRWSELSAPDVFRTFSFTRADAKSGPLIGLASYYGEIHASKDARGTLILRGDGPANWVQFETLHPEVGAIDHWSYVHRYLPGTDRYVLCFAARDGFYEYAGQAIRKASDKINATIDAMPQRTATRAEWITSTRAQYLNALQAGGSASINVIAGRYSSDGLRDTPGKLKIVNVLDYLGLDTDAQPLVSGGKIIAICKGPTEGEFVFAVDSDRKLYRTTDNFSTAPVIIAQLDDISNGWATTNTLVTDDHRVIEITYASISSKDKYWVFTSSTSETGYVALYNQTDDYWENNAAVMAGPYFWQADVEWKVYSSFSVINSTGNINDGYLGVIGVGTEQSQKRFYAAGNPSGANNANIKNTYLNHAQKIQFEINNSAGRVSILGATNISNIAGTLLYFGENTGFSSATLATGYYATRDDGTTSRLSSGSPLGYRWEPTNGFNIHYTERETALWRGGTFRPQSFWDSTTSKLWFAASGAEDANGWRSNVLYSLTAAAVATAVYTPTDNSCLAITTDGTNAWVTDQAVVSGFAGTGFVSRLIRVVLASGTSTHITDTAAGVLPLRISWNTDTSRIAVVGKYFTEATNAFAFSGFIGGLVASNGGYTTLKTFPAVNNTGAFPAELTYQTTTPFSHYAVMQNLQTGALAGVYQILKASAVVGDVSPLEAAPFDSFTLGIRSNAIFVAASGAANSYLWPDRIYWAASKDTNSDGTIDATNLIQRGVVGVWEVRGEFVSAQQLIGDFDAFDIFETDYAGQVDFYFRNADTQAALAASEEGVAPNAKISSASFQPPKDYVQWRSVLRWVYDQTGITASPATAVATTSPEVDFVAINYFFGAASLPRVVGIHWNGRTYWSVAEDTTVQNNRVLVYQKNDSWTKLVGWRIKGMWVFRNELVALEDYQFVRLEKGLTDLGNLIVGKARTGYLEGYIDKMLDGAQVNVLSFVNKNFPTKNGYVKITPYQADAPAEDVDDNVGDWVFPIPATTTPSARRVEAEPLDEYRYAWARSYALEFATSEESSGDFVAVVDQPELIQEISLDLFITGETHDIPVA